MVLDEGSESLEGMFVSKDYFRVVGLDPLLGRTFSDVEASFPPALVIVIGYIGIVPGVHPNVCLNAAM